MGRAGRAEEPCSIARTLEIVGERWTFLVLREAAWGTTRFADFAKSLGVAPDVLTDRLATLVGAGVLERRPYREAGSRTRDEYVLTEAGRELQVALTALQQWGDEHLPYSKGPTVLRRTAAGRPVHVGYVDDRGRELSRDKVRFVRTPAYPA